VRIGGGLLQPGHAAIGVVADDERDALIGKSGRGDNEAHHKRPETKHARAFTAKLDDAQATATGGNEDKKTPRWRAGSEGVWGTDMTGLSQSVSDH